MAKTLIIYPYADVNIGHTKSNTSSSGYSLINGATNNTTGSLKHELSTTVNTLTSTFTNLQQNSTITLGKIRLNSITSVNLYLTITKGQNATLTEMDIFGSVIIDGTTYKSSSYKPTGAVSNTARTLSVQSNNINKIYQSLSNNDIQFILSTTGGYTSSESKQNASDITIYNANVTISYDDVFDCKAEIMTGVGIASATPTAQEVIDGDICTFSATLQNDWRFVGWYTSSDFSGTPVSTSQTYTATITKNTILYPKAEPKYNINIYGDSTKFTYICSATGNKAYAGDTVTVTITPSKSIYKFAGIYAADINGNKLSTHISNDNPYTFTMPTNNLNLYIQIGKEIKVYVYCLNCSLASGTSPVITSSGKTETINITYDSATSEWSGIYQDSGYTVKLSDSQQYTFVVPENDVYLYAKAIAQQQIYVKENGIWQTYSKIYVKENGIWVEKEDYDGILDTLKNYKRIEL